MIGGSVGETTVGVAAAPEKGMDRLPGCTTIEPVFLGATQTIMRQVTIRTAEIHLSRLIEAALDGEEILIAEGGKPIVRLVPVARRRPFRIGMLAGQLGEIPDFLTAMEDAELDRRDGGGS